MNGALLLLGGIMLIAWALALYDYIAEQVNRRAHKP
jgi:hypothetical protein